MNDYLKHLLIGTPFEPLTTKIRHLLKSNQRSKHPELIEIYLESDRMTQVFKTVIHNSSNCIDIGCHLGSTLNQIIKLAPLGHHKAFEPIPYKAGWLKKKFPKVDVKQMALSNTLCDIIFNINKSKSGFSGLKLHNSKETENISKILVKCDKLDNILSPNYRVDFIKVDVEGAELGVLQGAVNILSKYRPVIIFECTKSGFSLFDYSSEQIFNFLTSEHSYSIFLFKDFLNKEKPLSFEKFDQALQYPFQAFNFLAIPRN